MDFFGIGREGNRSGSSESGGRTREMSIPTLGPGEEQTVSGIIPIPELRTQSDHGRTGQPVTGIEATAIWPGSTGRPWNDTGCLFHRPVRVNGIGRNCLVTLRG